jgi:hypothetical protein
MFHDLMVWLQTVPGATDGDPYSSWSQQFAGSLHLWSLTEGTHVLALMVFAGTILMVDLRMLGVVFRDIPYSALNNRILPVTVTGFAILLVTGALLFAANPVHYYHSVWFRLKVVFILLAAANIFWFHRRTQATIEAWDTAPSPPSSVKLAAAASLTCWILVIACGRLTAFTWFDCENVKPGSFAYAFAECAAEYGDMSGVEGAGE